MSEWKEYKLGDIVETTVDNRGKNPPYSENGHEVIETSSISGKNKYPDYSKVKKFVSQDCYNSWFRSGHPQKSDIIIISVGNGIGNMCIMKENRGVLTQNLIGLRINQKLASPDFIYYYLSWNPIQYYLQGLDIGSAQPSIKVPHLLNTLIPIPPLPEQRAIAGVLSSLDDKIDLLHRQNKTLEGMAEALFKSWFSKGENGSMKAYLNTYVSCINGVSYKSSELNPSKNALITLKSFNRHGGFSIEGFKEFTGKHKIQQIVFEGDLVVAHTDITQNAEVLGNPALVISVPKYETLIISMDLVKVVPKISWISKEFLYFLMRTPEFKYHCLGCSNGTTVLHLNKEAIPTFEFPIPRTNEVIEFTERTRCLLLKIFNNHRQIIKISRLRDILLPKLMSGEVRVRL